MFEPRGADAGSDCEQARGFFPIFERMWACIKIADRKIARQDKTVAVEEIGARNRRLIDRCRRCARRATFKNTHVDKAKTNERKSHHAKSRGDDDPPLDGGNALVLYPLGRNGRIDGGLVSAGHGCATTSTRYSLSSPTSLLLRGAGKIVRQLPA